MKFVENLTNGAKVITSGGIYGKFLRMEDNAAVIEIDNGVKIKIDKNYINSEATKALNPA